MINHYLEAVMSASLTEPGRQSKSAVMSSALSQLASSVARLESVVSQIEGVPGDPPMPDLKEIAELSLLNTLDESPNTIMGHADRIGELSGKLQDMLF